MTNRAYVLRCCIPRAARASCQKVNNITLYPTMQHLNTVIPQGFTFSSRSKCDERRDWRITGTPPQLDLSDELERLVAYRTCRAPQMSLRLYPPISRKKCRFVREIEIADWKMLVWLHILRLMEYFP
jgi:hypothetical protein